MNHYPVAADFLVTARLSVRIGRLGRVVALIACLFAVAFWLASPAHAATKIDPRLLGDWEVTRALMPQSLRPQQWTMRANDPRLMSRALAISTEGVNFQRYEPTCAMAPMVGAKRVSMRVLFAKAGDLKRPAVMKGLLYGRAADYELGSLTGRSVDRWQVTCKSIDGQKQPFANWIAFSSVESGKATSVFFPGSYGALLVMEQCAPQSHAPAAAQTEFCKQAASASDHAICANRQLWRLHSFALAARARVVSDRPDFNASIDTLNNEQLKNREACNGDATCLYEALDRQLFILGMNMTR